MRTGIRGKARTAFGATACALAMLLVGSVAAHAETTEIGETPPVASPDFTPSQEDPGFARVPTVCPADVNLVQAQTGAAPVYDVPFDGVITEWSHRGVTLAEPDADAGQGRLLVWRPGDDDEDGYTLVGKSDAESFPPNELGTFETSIAVEEGDLLGLRTEADGVGCFFTHLNESSMDDEVRFQAPSSPDDAPAIPPDGGDDPLPDLGDEGVPGDVVDEECDPTEPTSCQPWFCETFFFLAQDQCEGFSPPAGAATPSAAAEPEVGEEQAFAPVSGQGARLNVAAVLEPAPEPEPEEVVEAAEDEAPPPPVEEPPAAPAETEDTQPAPATPASTLALAGRAKQKLGKRVRVAARCLAEACEVVARGRLVVRIPGKGKGSVRTRRFALRPVSATLEEGERTVLALTLRKGARKAARRALARRGGARVRVTVLAVNEAGNEVSVTRGIRVRRG